MKLSIIIPFYNAERHIEKCLYSLLNQNLNEQDYEIILIDDGSTDNGKIITESYIKNLKNVAIYSQKNIGLGASRNVGIEIAKGDYIYFIDSDDYIAFNMLGVLLKHLETFELELIGFKSLSTSKLDLFQSQTIDTNVNFEIVSGAEFCANSEHFLVQVWWYIIKRDLLITTGIRFSEGRFLEDGPFTFRLFLETNRMLYLPLDIHRYFKVDDSIMNKTDSNHLEKLIDDYKYLIHDFNSQINDILNKKNPKLLGVIKKIQFWSDVNVYMLFYRFIKVNWSVKKIDNVLNEFNAIGAYPLTCFIGNKYNSTKHKWITFLFNKKYLFYFLLYPLRLLHRFKLIKLP
jgi:glycosyltransferase involved in cell wall biosynthesis